MHATRASVVNESHVRSQLRLPTHHLNELDPLSRAAASALTCGSHYCHDSEHNSRLRQRKPFAPQRPCMSVRGYFTEVPVVIARVWVCMFARGTWSGVAHLFLQGVVPQKETVNFPLPCDFVCSFSNQLLGLSIRLD